MRAPPVLVTYYLISRHGHHRLLSKRPFGYRISSRTFHLIPVRLYPFHQYHRLQCFSHCRDLWAGRHPSNRGRTCGLHPWYRIRHRQLRCTSQFYISKQSVTRRKRLRCGSESSLRHSKFLVRYSIFKNYVIRNTHGAKCGLKIAHIRGFTDDYYHSYHVRISPSGSRSVLTAFTGVAVSA